MKISYDDMVAIEEEKQRIKQEEEYLEQQMLLEVKARAQREREIAEYEKHWY